jgi:hypothetical protein
LRRRSDRISDAAVALALILTVASLLVAALTVSSLQARESAPEVAEIAVPPFVVRSPRAMRFEAERIAPELPGRSLRIAADLGLPALADATITLVGGGIPQGHPLYDAAAGVPAWAAGIALPSAGEIIVRMDRIGSYGRRQLMSVIEHELTHLTVAAALPRRGRELPPWLREGIACFVAHEWEWRDVVVVWTSGLGSIEHPFAALDATLSEGEPSQAIAYAGSLAAVGFLQREYGEDFLKRLLSGMRGGASFESAFLAQTGVAVDDAERAWARDLRRPRRWILWITSALTLWIGITLLILLAYAIKRYRSRRQIERWREEEGPLERWEDEGGPPPLIPGDDDGRVH